jgi:hypothetical protein
MKRLAMILFVGVGLLPSARGQTAEEKKATIAYLRGLQSPAGGFWAAKPGAQNGDRKRPSLRAAAGALRALKYFGGEVPDRKAAIQFVESCFDRRKGCFRDSPTSTGSDPIITAIGLMAVVELKMPGDKYSAAAVAYLEEHSQSFEEIRMAAAGLESIGKRSDRAAAWIKAISRMRNADGTYGKGAALARDTGGSVVAVLRLGGKVENRERVVKALWKGQRKDGGFGKGDADGSDLESCYRVVRAFVMLKEKPADVPALRKLVGKCRNEDGGYGIAPGKPSAVGSTYFAATILHWLDQ